MYQEMLTQNKELFESFKKVHYSYAQDSKTWRPQFNEEGNKVMIIIRRYESRLCGKSEGSGFGKFTGSLAEKFRIEIRKDFPLIDEVGLR